MSGLPIRGGGAQEIWPTVLCKLMSRLFYEIAMAGVMCMCVSICTCMCMCKCVCVCTFVYIRIHMFMFA